MATPKVIYDYNPNNLPSDMLEAIGFAISCASQAESIIDMTIGGCMGLDSLHTVTLTAHMPIPLKVSILKATAEFKLEVDALDELDELLAEMDKALGKRNKYAHDTWCQNDAGDIFRHTTSARGSLEMKLEPTTVDQIKAEGRFIYKVAMDLMKFIMKHSLIPPHTPAAPRDHKTPAARKKRRQMAAKK